MQHVHIQKHLHAHIQSSGDGLTPLHMAAAHGHVSVVELLLSYGADAHVQDRWRRTCVFACRPKAYVSHLYV
jgi:ankyrin repeat protein